MTQFKTAKIERYFLEGQITKRLHPYPPQTGQSCISTYKQVICLSPSLHCTVTGPWLLPAMLLVHCARKNKKHLCQKHLHSPWVLERASKKLPGLCLWDSPIKQSALAF